MLKNAESAAINEKVATTTAATACAAETQGNNENFNVNIVKQTVTSVTIDWNLIAHADVYKIEKYQRVRGWEKVAWTCESPAIIENLEDNFAYRFRIRALKYDAEQRAYVDYKVSADFLGSTLPPPPTTMALYRAIKKGHQFLVKRLLRRRPSLIDYPGPNGYLPLANAIIGGEDCIVDVLLTAGASVHIGNPGNGRTPLMLACYYGRLAVARILLNKKAQLETGDINGMTACHFAVDGNQCELLKFALDNNANTEARDDCGWTLLARAAVMRTDMGFLKLLLQHGADVRAVDRLGQSCVDLARLYKNEVAMQFFAKFLKAKEKAK